MKTTRWTLGLAAALLATAAFDAAGQCENANTLADIYGGSIPSYPEFTRVFRPDLSNPGARALGIGGAFLSSADDATSVIANPAGLGAIVRPAFQLEARPFEQPQYDRYGDGLTSNLDSPGDPFIQLDKTKGLPPLFASFVVPVADKLVVAGFYQQMLNADRTVDRNGTGDTASLRRGPCYATSTPSGAATQAYALTYRLHDESKLWRTGLSFGFRATYQLTFGATAYYVKEQRDYSIQAGDAFGAGQVSPFASEDGKFGFILGAQFTPTENLRLGAVFASKVALKDTESLTPSRDTILPMRIGLGLNFSPSSSLSLSFEGVYVGTSAYQNFDYSRGFQTWLAVPGDAASPADSANWKADDSFEARFGLEWSFVQTRTQIIALRAGYYAVSPSNLRYVAGPSKRAENRALFDYIRLTSPNVDDPWLHHVTGGFGAVFNRKFQIDLGADYEFAETKALVLSGLVGYTF